MLKLLKNLSRKELFLTLICLILIVGQVWLDLRMPEYLAEITRLVQTEGSRALDVLAQGGMMLLVAAASMVISIIIGYIAANIAAVFTKVTQAKIFKKVASFSMGEIKELSVPSLITRTTNDVTQVRNFISLSLHLLIRSPILAVWAIIRIWGQSLQWTMLIGITIFILMVIAIIMMAIVLPKFKLVQKLTDNLNRVTRENLIGIRVVRAFNAEDYQQTKFKDANNELTNLQIFTGRIMALMWPILLVSIHGLTLGVYALGAYIINDAVIYERLDLLANMMVFSMYAIFILQSFLMLVFVFISYPRASVSGKRILEVLETNPAVISGSGEAYDEKGTIVFKNVTFKYPDAEEAMLHNISFKAKKGETVAIIGSTGCGKSTLINLIPRFYDATDGEILVNGVNVKDYKLETLHDIIGYIPQRAVIFNGTVKDNISYGEVRGKKPKPADVKYAVEVAQTTEIIENMPKKYKTELSQGGTNISGGQKQRIAISRAIARKPDIFIFDDSFSALDYKTDYLLRKELNNKVKDATKIIVAQRIGTIKDADQIIVLEEGKMVGHGKHEELLKTCEVYQEIALSQLSKEEL